jgi:hypothetical protein
VSCGSWCVTGGKLVALRSHCKAEIHAVLAKCGVQVSMTDLVGVAGIDLLTRVELPGVYRGRIDSLRRLMDTLELELDMFTGIVRARLSDDPGYIALGDHSRDRADTGGGVRRRDRGCAPFHRAGAAGLLVRG